MKETGADMGELYEYWDQQEEFGRNRMDSARETIKESRQEVMNWAVPPIWEQPQGTIMSADGRTYIYPDGTTGKKKGTSGHPLLLMLSPVGSAGPIIAGAGKVKQISQLVAVAATKSDTGMAVVSEAAGVDYSPHTKEGQKAKTFTKFFSNVLKALSRAFGN